MIVSHQHHPPIEICFRITMKTCFSWYFYGVVHFESEFVMSQSKHLLITKSQKCWIIRLLIIVVVSRKTGKFCDRLQLHIFLLLLCTEKWKGTGTHTEAIIVSTHCKMMPRPPRRYPLWLCSVQVWVYSWILTRRHDEPIYKRPALGCGEWAAVMDVPRDEWWWMTRLLVTLMMIPSLHKHQLRPYVMKMVKTC